MSSVSPAVLADHVAPPALPRCPKHKELRMRPTLVERVYGGRGVPVRAYACPACDEIAFHADDLAALQEYVATMGLGKPPKRRPARRA